MISIITMLQVTIILKSHISGWFTLCHISKKNDMFLFIILLLKENNYNSRRDYKQYHTGRQ